MDSTQIDIDSFKGKLLIIDFWATFCSPCIKEAPIFKKLAKKYEQKDVVFISISMDNSFSKWKEYILWAEWERNDYWFDMRANEPFSFLLYSKSKSEDPYAYSVQLPNYVFISPKGKILSTSKVRPSQPEFEEYIEQYLKKYDGSAS